MVGGLSVVAAMESSRCLRGNASARRLLTRFSPTAHFILQKRRPKLLSASNRQRSNLPLLEDMTSMVIGFSILCLINSPHRFLMLSQLEAHDCIISPSSMYAG